MIRSRTTEVPTLSRSGAKRTDRRRGGRRAAAQYRTTGYPETFVLDRNGRVLQHVVGPAEWDSTERLAYFRGVLEGGPAR